MVRDATRKDSGIAANSDIYRKQEEPQAVFERSYLVVQLSAHSDKRQPPGSFRYSWIHTNCTNATKQACFDMSPPEELWLRYASLSHAVIRFVMFMWVCNGAPTWHLLHANQLLINDFADSFINDFGTDFRTNSHI